MAERVLEEITVGLSDAEKDDLEEMIKAFRQNQTAVSETPSSEDVHKQILLISENLAKYADVLLKFDTKLKLLYGILQLSDQKNRIMNQRIDTIIELLQGQKTLAEK